MASRVADNKTIENKVIERTVKLTRLGLCIEWHLQKSLDLVLSRNSITVSEKLRKDKF